MYIGDVGGNDPNTAIEEVNLGARRCELRLALVRGRLRYRRASPARSIEYPHLGRDASITGGVVYRGTQFPSEYQGSYFFGDYVQNTIRRLKFDGQRQCLQGCQLLAGGRSEGHRGCRRPGQVPRGA